MMHGENSTRAVVIVTVSVSFEGHFLMGPSCSCVNLDPLLLLCQTNSKLGSNRSADDTSLIKTCG